jgi:hypothetical protein
MYVWIYIYISTRNIHQKHRELDNLDNHHRCHPQGRSTRKPWPVSRTMCWALGAAMQPLRPVDLCLGRSETFGEYLKILKMNRTYRFKLIKLVGWWLNMDPEMACCEVQEHQDQGTATWSQQFDSPDPWSLAADNKRPVLFHHNFWSTTWGYLRNLSTNGNTAVWICWDVSISISSHQTGTGQNWVPKNGRVQVQNWPICGNPWSNGPEPWYQTTRGPSLHPRTWFSLDVLWPTASARPFQVQVSSS